jgi:hypothetical protein
MYGFVQVIEDGRNVDLLFADKEQAKQFIDFVHVYMIESGAGNGYGAYWHLIGNLGNPVVGVDTKVGQGFLKTDLIQAMALSICDARAARPHAWQGGNVTVPEYMPLMGIKDGTIVFQFTTSDLPHCIAPKKGDLARIVDNPKYYKCIGRVKEARDSGLFVIAPCEHSFLTEEIELPAFEVMKIYDFLKKE